VTGDPGGARCARFVRSAEAFARHLSGLVKSRPKGAVPMRAWQLLSWRCGDVVMCEVVMW